MDKKCTFRLKDIYKAKNDAMPVRYVCKDCLRTFKDEIYNPTYVCWKCGGNLVAIEIYKGVVSNEKKNN